MPSDTRRGLRLVNADGLAYSTMVGLGEHYIAAFVLALGLGELTAGLVAVLPVLAGGFLQLVSPWGVRRLGSRRRWVVACVTVQASAFLPLVVGAILGRIPSWLVFATAALYWAGGMAANTAWNAWVERIVPSRLRSDYFARRSGMVNAGVLVSLLAGGAVLDAAGEAGRPLAGFALLFALAMTARFLSSRVLAATPEPAIAGDRTVLEAPRLPLPRRLPTGDDARLLSYSLALIACTTVASPYFTPFMLRRLELTYGGYTVLIGIALLSKVLVMPLLARSVRRLGLVRLLRAAWLGIAAIPILWLVSDDYAYLCGLQVMAGAAWATHEYALFLLIFETVASERRVRVLSAYNLADAVVKSAGVLAGAAFFRWSGIGGDGYVTLFVVSTVLRAGCLILLLRVRSRAASTWTAGHLRSWRPLAVRPAAGGWHLPVLLSRFRHPDRGDEERPGGG